MKGARKFGMTGQEFANEAVSDIRITRSPAKRFSSDQVGTLLNVYQS